MVSADPVCISNKQVCVVSADPVCFSNKQKLVKEVMAYALCIRCWYIFCLCNELRLNCNQ